MYYPRIVHIGVAEEGDGSLSGRINEANEHLNEARKSVNKEKEKDKNVILTIAYTDKVDD